LAVPSAAEPEGEAAEAVARNPSAEGPEGVPAEAAAAQTKTPSAAEPEGAAAEAAAWMEPSSTVELPSLPCRFLYHCHLPSFVEVQEAHPAASSNGRGSG